MVVHMFAMLLRLSKDGNCGSELVSLGTFGIHVESVIFVKW